MSTQSPQEVPAALARIAAHVRRTPLLEVTLAGHELWLKLEHLQVSGSFKARGATNALMRLGAPSRVVAASGGNHGLGVAHAAGAVGAEAVVVVPASVAEEKAKRLAAAGATVVRHGREYAEAEEHALALAEADALPFIHPFADPEVIAGQGTVALEILQDLTPAGCDAVVVAVGGGGLLAGTGLACAGSGIAAWGVEPEGIPTVHAALSAGEPVDVEMNSITASALGARRTHPANLGLIREHARGVALVGDGAILHARDLLWDECRLAVEPGAAAALAGVLSGQIDAEKPCVVLCGANTTWMPS